MSDKFSVIESCIIARNEGFSRYGRSSVYHSDADKGKLIDELLSEAFETWQAVHKGKSPDAIYDEIAQVAALALAALERFAPDISGAVDIDQHWYDQ